MGSERRAERSLGERGHAFASRTGTSPLHVFLNIGDHLGSATIAIEENTSEVVERATYQSFGALESDYRPDRWGHARQPYKFTGKEEDIEVGATYFGARYYQPHLGRFLSPDPLTIHALSGDLNPYAYVRGRVMGSVDPLGLDGDGGGDGGGGDFGPAVTTGTFTQADGTTVTTTGSPLAIADSAIQAAAIVADQIAAIEGAHLPLGGGTYITPGDVQRETVNAIATLPVNVGASLIDPLGLVRLAASFSGHPIASPRVVAATTDPKNISSVPPQIAGGVIAVVSGRGAGAAPGAAEEIGAGGGGGQSVARVLLHDTGHTSIVTEVGGEALQTDQVRILGGKLVTIAEGASEAPVISTATVPLPNGPAAQAFQRGVIGKPGGFYNITRNNCSGHCADVLRAGGAQGVPADSTLLVPWLFGP